MLNNKSILITGRTGSPGTALTAHIFKKYPDMTRLVVFSRDEQKQYHMAHDYSHDKYPQIRFFIGDVRDFERLKRAMRGIDYVIHAAAMKHVPIAPKGTCAGIIPVDFAGRAIDISAFKELADEFRLWIVEDACHAPGGYFTGANRQSHKCGSGTFADLVSG